MRYLAALLLASCAFAQLPYATSLDPSPNEREIPANRGAAALWQTLKKLNTRASLMMITAHPDDEDGGMLAYESRGQGVRVSLLTLNRGEGGANVMSPDYFDALGLVRTMELLKAGEYYGVKQYWTRVIDYGFSKTKAESLSKWTHDRVLYDVVRAVRIERPLVITSVFVGGPTDGHGNHQTAGQMAQEVFKAAGDPNVFPDQIAAGLRPWQPLKVYARVPFQKPGEFPANVQIPEGDYDPLLGESYVQLAREGLGLQKSQNGGGIIQRAGQSLSPYHRFGSKVPTKDHESSFFDGIDTSLSGLGAGINEPNVTRSLRTISEDVEKAVSSFRAEQPDSIAPVLAQGLYETNSLLEQIANSHLSDQVKYNLSHELEAKQTQFNNALALALGLTVDATVVPEKPENPLFEEFMGEAETFRVAIPGQKFPVRVRFAKRTNEPVQVSKVEVGSFGEGPTASGLKPNELSTVRFTVKIPEDAPYTRPYFTRPNIEQTYYDIQKPEYLNQPLAPYPLAAWVRFAYRGVAVSIGRYVQTVQRITGQGSVYEPLAVGPAISVGITPQAGIVPLDSKTFSVTTVIHSNVKGEAKGTVKLDLPQGWSSQPESAAFSTPSDGADQSLTFQVTPRNLKEQPYTITAAAEYGGRTYKEGYTVTGYPTLRPYFLYRPATYRLSGVDVKTAPGLKVAYVTGSGDDVPASLEHLGIHVAFLGHADISSGDLSKYDVILLGVRTYAVRDDLRTYNSRLLDYVKNGGAMIVQYNTPEFDHNYGPYPYTMTEDPEEVTDEASAVQILDPKSPVFNWPNKITEGDFKGWVEERGSKWMRTWDRHYEPLLEAHDAGQAPQKGGLLYAKYGKGIYIYNAWAFYRELPEGVAGAYRLFANMLSLPKNPNR